MRFLIVLLAIQCSPAPAQGIIPDQYTRIVFHYCAETGIPVYIAVGIITEESGWNELARNKIAGGLMQLSFSNHAEFRDKYNNGREFSEFDPVANVRIGLRYYAHLYHWLGTFRKACYFYATGYSTHIKKWVRKIVDRELEGV